MAGHMGWRGVQEGRKQRREKPKPHRVYFPALVYRALMPLGRTCYACFFDTCPRKYRWIRHLYQPIQHHCVNFKRCPFQTTEYPHEKKTVVHFISTSHLMQKLTQDRAYKPRYEDNLCVLGLGNGFSDMSAKKRREN